MVTYIEELSVKKNHWVDEETFRHGVALCQTLPGAIAVNTAAYVGMKIKGVRGMLAAFCGFLLPAFLLLLIFSIIYQSTRNLPLMGSLFHGLQVMVVAIIAYATFAFGKNTVKEKKDIAIAALSALALLLKLNPFIVVIGAMFMGLILYDVLGVKAKTALYIPLVSFRTPLLLISCFFGGLSALFIFDKMLFDLALTMTKIELFAFGGGYTALTLMFHEVVEAKAWLDSSTFMDGVALGQITPGPVLITATFIGYLLRGLSGAFIGTLAIFAPGIMLVAFFTPVFDKVKASTFFQRGIKGIISCFTGLLLSITIKFLLAVSWNISGIVLGIAAFIALVRKVDVLYIILAGAAVSFFIF